MLKLFCSTLICFAVGSELVFAQSPKTTKDHETKKVSRVDVTAAIEAIVSKNIPPKLVGERGFQDPIFSERFDSNDSERVDKAIRNLISMTPEAWSQMVEHLDDSRYSITYELQDNPYNLSVGNVCQFIICDTLQKPYYYHLPVKALKSEQAFHRLRFDRLLTKDELKPWCKSRETKKLFELQIDAALLAISEMNRLKDVPAGERKESEDSIKEEITKLERTKTPALLEKFYENYEVGRYGDESAKMIRDQYRAKE